MNVIARFVSLLLSPIVDNVSRFITSLSRFVTSLLYPRSATKILPSPYEVIASLLAHGLLCLCNALWLLFNLDSFWRTATFAFVAFALDYPVVDHFWRMLKIDSGLYFYGIRDLHSTWRLGFLYMGLIFNTVLLVFSVILHGFKSSGILLVLITMRLFVLVWLYRSADAIPQEPASALFLVEHGTTGTTHNLLCDRKKLRAVSLSSLSECYWGSACN